MTDRPPLPEVSGDVSARCSLSPATVGLGAALGMVMGISNLYVGLKLGWSVGVVVTASVLGWALWSGAHRLGVAKARPTVQEVNLLASTASAAGYSTGATLASAGVAFALLTGAHLPWWQWSLWVLSVSGLGVCLAVPLRHRLIEVERLPFPTGAAAAEVLRGLARDSKHASTQVRSLVWGAMVAAVVSWMVGGAPWMHEAWGWPSAWALPPRWPVATSAGTAVALGWSIEVGLVLPAAGALAGVRVGASVLLGALLCFCVAVPQVAGWTDGAVDPGRSFAEAVKWSLWPGTALMVVGGVGGLLVRLRPRSVPKRQSVSSGRAVVAGARRGVGSLWAGGVGCGVGCMVLLCAVFDTPWTVAAAAVLLAVALAVVASRVVGETDVGPVGPLGKLSQLALGQLTPGLVANVMGAGVSAGAAASAADLLTDFKSGALLGVPPWAQLRAQLLGVVVGAVWVVPVFVFVVASDIGSLGGARWPAPAAKAWVGFAALASQGLAAVPPGAGVAAAVAAVVAVGLVGVRRLWPTAAPYVPSAAALGIAFILPPGSAVALGLGALVAAAIRWRTPGGWVLPAACGALVGESLAGTAATLLGAFG